MYAGKKTFTLEQLCPQMSKRLGHHPDHALHIQAPIDF